MCSSDLFWKKDDAARKEMYMAKRVRFNQLISANSTGDADFIRAYSQPRNYGFNTAVGTGYAMGRNTIAACIHQDQTLTDGQAVKLRLLEPMQAGNIVVPKNTLVAGTAKVQGERLDILVSSIEYAGNIIPLELAVFDTDGQKGLSVPSSMEQEAFNEAMAVSYTHLLGRTDNRNSVLHQITMIWQSKAAGCRR